MPPVTAGRESGTPILINQPVEAANIKPWHSLGEKVNVISVDRPDVQQLPFRQLLKKRHKLLQDDTGVIEGLGIGMRAFPGSLC